MEDAHSVQYYIKVLEPGRDRTGVDTHVGLGDSGLPSPRGIYSAHIFGDP